MKHLIRGLGIGLIAVTVMASAKGHTLTVDKAVEFALEHSPDIDISRFDFEGAKERSKFQEGYYLPRLDLSATAGRTGVDYEDQDSLSGNVLVGNLSASQLIYDFGKTSGRISAADEQANAFKARMNQFISAKIFYTKRDFYEVLKVISIIEVAKKNIELQKGQLRRAQRYYDNGIRTIVDVSDSQVRLTRAKLDLNNAEYQLKLTRAILEQTMGYVPYSGKYKLYNRKLDLRNVSQHLPRVNTSTTQLEGFAYEHRYELQSSKYLAQSAKFIVESEEGGYLPTLSLSGNYQKQNVDDDFVALTPEKQWNAGVDLTWNLFSGNQTDASVQEAKISALKASSNIDDVRLRIKREVIESSLAVQRTKDSVTLSESIAKTSEIKYDQVKKRYENDLADYIELQEAQTGYINALGDLVVSYYDYFISLAGLDYSVGR